MMVRARRVRKMEGISLGCSFGLSVLLLLVLLRKLELNLLGLCVAGNSWDDSLLSVRSDVRRDIRRNGKLSEDRRLDLRPLNETHLGTISSS